MEEVEAWKHETQETLGRKESRTWAAQTDQDITMQHVREGGRGGGETRIERDRGGWGGGERERERESEGGRERDRETERQRDRETERQKLLK
jgi:RNA-binding motif X-linked protein 2